MISSRYSGNSAARVAHVAGILAFDHADLELARQAEHRDEREQASARRSPTAGRASANSRTGGANARAEAAGVQRIDADRDEGDSLTSDSAAIASIMP